MAGRRFDGGKRRQLAGSGVAVARRGMVLVGKSGKWWWGKVRKVRRARKVGKIRWRVGRCSGRPLLQRRRCWGVWCREGVF
jgi:hypothetical protein